MDSIMHVTTSRLVPCLRDPNTMQQTHDAPPAVSNVWKCHVCATSASAACKQPHPLPYKIRMQAQVKIMQHYVL